MKSHISLIRSRGTASIRTSIAAGRTRAFGGVEYSAEIASGALAGQVGVVGGGIDADCCSRATVHVAEVMSQILKSVGCVLEWCDDFAPSKNPIMDDVVVRGSGSSCLVSSGCEKMPNVRNLPRSAV